MSSLMLLLVFFFFQAEDGIRDTEVTGVQTCALPIFNEELGRQLDAILDSGDAGHVPTTVVDLTGAEPQILRLGGGDPALFEP